MSRFATIFALVLAMFVLFDPTLRSALGSLVGYGLEPLIGFGGKYPVFTLFLAEIGRAHV